MFGIRVSLEIIDLYFQVQFEDLNIFFYLLIIQIKRCSCDGQVRICIYIEEGRSGEGVLAEVWIQLEDSMKVLDFQSIKVELELNDCLRIEYCFKVVLGVVFCYCVVFIGVSQKVNL